MNIIVVGAGAVGMYIAKILSKEEHNVILVDLDGNRLEQASWQMDVATRVGSGTDWQLLDTLLEQIPDVIIALTDNDETNLVTCTIAKNLGYPRTIARIRNPNYLNRTRLDFTRLFNIDHFVGPEILTANDIFKYTLFPGSTAVETFAQGAVQMRTIQIPKNWRGRNQPLHKLNLPSGIMVGLIRRYTTPEERKTKQIPYRVIFPHGNDTILPEDEVTFIGETGDEIMIEQSESQILTTKYLFYGTIEPVRDPQTGAILYSGIEAVGKALLYWRSLMQWLGGVGIVVLFIAVLPALGVGGKVLLHAEMPGPIKDSLTPRIKETAIHLSKIYLGLTLAQVLMLRATNSDIGWFEAMTITFSTLSTGGFTIRNQSIGGLHSAHTDWVVILFMLMGATNFSLYFHILRGRIYKIYDAEFIVYMIIVFCCAVYASFFLYDTPKMLLNGMIEGTYSLSEAIRHGTFQMVSAQTSTGFVTQNYDFWPFSVQWLMIMVMFFGGMSGSTSGGMKIVRLNMLFLILQNKVESLFRPQAVRKLHVGTREVDTGVAITLLCFFLVLTFFTYFGTFWLINNQIDPETAFTVTICMINNIGIAFRAAGPTESFAFLPDNCLVMSCLWMLLGRLEFFALLVVLVPGFWREN